MKRIVCVSGFRELKGLILSFQTIMIVTQMKTFYLKEGDTPHCSHYIVAEPEKLLKPYLNYGTKMFRYENTRCSTFKKNMGIS